MQPSFLCRYVNIQGAEVQFWSPPPHHIGPAQLKATQHVSRPDTPPPTHTHTLQVPLLVKILPMVAIVVATLEAVVVLVVVVCFGLI